MIAMVIFEALGNVSMIPKVFYAIGVNHSMMEREFTVYGAKDIMTGN